jgi:glycosyltransferase involved in cell wall biosynthesis
VGVRVQLLVGALRKAVIAIRERRLSLSPRRWRQLLRLHAAEQAQEQLTRSAPPLPPVRWPSSTAARGQRGLSGFHPQSHEEATDGVAWMGSRSRVALAGVGPSSTITVAGHHLASAHRRGRGSASVRFSGDLDGTPVFEVLLDRDGAFEASFTIPAESSPLAVLHLVADQAFVPAAARLGTDTRELSVQIRRVTVDDHALLDFGRPAGAFQPRTDADEAPGLTIVGYLSDGTGVSAGAHASQLACESAGLPCELIDARPLRAHRGSHPTSLLHVNADQTAIIAGLLGDDFFRNRYTIGHWAWELEQLPDSSAEAFDWLDEVWAPSAFVVRAIADRSAVPVVQMPYAVTVDPSRGLTRQHFGLPDEDFLYLMMYDVLSVQERKNPLGAIAAFQQAFPRPNGVGLVVRVNHARSRPEDVDVVRQAAATPGVHLLVRPMSRADVQALQASCDAFVSLHRSEGFGLNIAEAMLLGKPVIVTGWSGNVDFTNPGNACVVDHDLVTIDRDHGPYRAGNRWAEPDLEHASEYLRRLVEDEAFRRRLANRGRETVATELSPRAIGERYARRLAFIRRRRAFGAVPTVPAGV